MSDDEFQQRYKVGDMLKHKASGERAIVVYAAKSWSDAKCEGEVEYRLSYGIGRQTSMRGDDLAMEFNEVSDD